MKLKTSWQRYDIYPKFSKKLHLQSLIFIRDMQKRSRLSSYLSQPNVLHMESNFTGVVASDVTENENIGREIRADDIKTMSLSGKIEETLPVNSIEMN